MKSLIHFPIPDVEVLLGLHVVIGRLWAGRDVIVVGSAGRHTRRCRGGLAGGRRVATRGSVCRRVARERRPGGWIE